MLESSRLYWLINILEKLSTILVILFVDLVTSNVSILTTGALGSLGAEGARSPIIILLLGLSTGGSSILAEVLPNESGVGAVGLASFIACSFSLTAWALFTFDIALLTLSPTPDAQSFTPAGIQLVTSGDTKGILVPPSKKRLTSPPFLKAITPPPAIPCGTCCGA